MARQNKPLQKTLKWLKGIGVTVKFKQRKIKGEQIVPNLGFYNNSITPFIGSKTDRGIFPPDKQQAELYAHLEAQVGEMIRYGEIDVLANFSKGFTTCIIEYHTKQTIAHAICGPSDKFNGTIGAAISLNIALHRLAANNTEFCILWQTFVSAERQMRRAVNTNISLKEIDFSTLEFAYSINKGERDGKT